LTMQKHSKAAHSRAHSLQREEAEEEDCVEKTDPEEKRKTTGDGRQEQIANCHGWVAQTFVLAREAKQDTAGGQAKVLAYPNASTPLVWDGGRQC
jgi:hypothetical protein